MDVSENRVYPKKRNFHGTAMIGPVDLGVQYQFFKEPPMILSHPFPSGGEPIPKPRLKLKPSGRPYLGKTSALSSLFGFWNSFQSCLLLQIFIFAP